MKKVILALAVLAAAGAVAAQSNNKQSRYYQDGYNSASSGQSRSEASCNAYGTDSDKYTCWQGYNQGISDMNAASNGTLNTNTTTTNNNTKSSKKK